MNKSTNPLKRKLDLELPAKKRPALADRNSQVENRSVPLKHGMQLRRRSPEPPRKKKTSPKKDSPPPTIKRPESPEDAQSSEGMVLRPKQSSPEQPLPTQKEARVLTKNDTPPPPYKGDDPEEAKRVEKERLEWREARQFLYVDLIKERSVSHKGFTQRELDLCRPYMLKQDFELKSSIPKDKKFLKEFLDQVRATKGYGVTRRYQTLDGRGFFPLKGDLENDPATIGYVQDMIKLLLAAMKRKRNLTYTAAAEVMNLVEAANWFYMLTLRVSHTKVVEALFYRRPGGGVRKIKLLEWKIKQGSKVKFCTEKLIL